jgi:hypothetical protein
VPRSGIMSSLSWQSPFCGGNTGIPFRGRKSDNTLSLLPFYRICLVFRPKRTYAESAIHFVLYGLQFIFLVCD